ncbi:MAG TPA: DUF2339 domain-containing protein, partial [Thermoanaerobaculia bacterium]|nr:DUF2339 domain-containing protein [Thermoanaerobaculia bacterium]
MECLTAAVLVVAVVVLVLGYRQSRAGTRAEERQQRETEALRAVVFRLQERLAELERLAGVRPATVPPPATVPAPQPVEAPAAPPVVSEGAVEAPRPISVPPPIVPPPAPPPARPSPPGPLSRLPFPPSPGEGGKAAPGLEELLGSRLLVWIGSIALALAGAFLVKYSFEQGWLSPTVRVALGVLFGVVLLAGGEKMRPSSPGIARGLAAAGVADLFACFLAGVHLYQLISPAAGFFFMVLTTAVAVLLSLRHGMMVALIGMIGGFLTPALIRVGEPDARNLFAYLFLLVAGLLAVSVRRGWQPLAAAALAAGLLWVLFWLGEPFQPGDGLWLSLFLLASAGAALVADLGGGQAESWISRGMLAGAFLGLALTTGRTDWAPSEWAFLGVLAAGTLVLARLRPEFLQLAWVAAGTPLALLAAWGSGVEEAEISRFLWTAGGFGALLAVGAYLAHLRASRPGWWAALSAASGVGYFLVAWFFTPAEHGLPWGGAALAIAALYLAAAVPVARGGAKPALAALAVAVTTFVSLAVSLELERHWWTAGWAIEVTALVWLAGRFRLPVLVKLAGLLAAGVAVRLLLNPLIFIYPIGDHLILNWMVYGYGVPILAFAAAARLARQQGEERLAGGLEAGAIALGFTLVTLEVRQFFHPGEPEAGDFSLGEWATLAIAWLVLGWGLLAGNREPRLASLERGGRAILALGTTLGILGPVLFANPLWNHEPVGETPIWNLLLWVYGVPAALTALAARELRSRGSARLPFVLASASILFV